MEELGLDIEHLALEAAMSELGLSDYTTVADKKTFEEVVSKHRAELKKKFQRM